MIRLLITLLVFIHPVVFAFDSGRAGIAVQVNDIVIPYREFAVFSMPGETLQISLVEPGPIESIIESPLQATPFGAGSWSVQSPREPGLYEIIVGNPESRIQINLFVLHPLNAQSGDKLNGYTIGSYPEEPLRGDPLYLAPEGLIELNADTENVRVSPHFTLKQFPSKQSQGFPKYLILREPLLLKLELLLERVNARGIDTKGFVIMSGYRTPHYNRAIGNVPNSRHVYGGAADIYIDVSPEDGVMDDLNGDGKLNYLDAQYLYRLADRLFREKQHRWLIGGQGVYRSNPAHGPFLHVDARGQRARWGLIPAEGE